LRDGEKAAEIQRPGRHPQSPSHRQLSRDACAASAFGIKVVRRNRLPGAPDREVKSLSDLPALIGALLANKIGDLVPFREDAGPSG